MGELIELVKGTKEKIAVDVVDRFDDFTSLTSLLPTYSVRRMRDRNWILVDELAETDLMTALCYIDTSLSVFDTSGEYELYIDFNNPPEEPRVGPFPFYLIGAPIVPTVREIRDENADLVVQIGIDGIVHVRTTAIVEADLP